MSLFEVPDRVRGHLVFAASITGTGGLVKTGAGSLLLSGVNTYSGSTIVNEGTLELQGIQPLGGNVIIHGDSTLVLDDGVVLDGSHNAILGGGSPSVEVKSGEVATSNVGINEQLPFTVLHKAGGGTLVLNGVSTYSGGTQVTDGIRSV